MTYTGIIYKVSQYKEKDAIINIINKDGLKSLLVHRAFSIHSPYGDILLPLTYCEFTVSDKKEKTLKEAKVLSNTAKTHNTLEKNSFSLLVSEVLTNHIPDYEKHFLFECIKELLNLLENDYDPKALSLIFLANALRVMGFSIDVSSCKMCGNKNNIVALSINNGGIVCEKCARSNDIKINLNLYNILKFIFLATPKDYIRFKGESSDVDKIFIILSDYITNKLEISLKSLELLK